MNDDESEESSESSESSEHAGYVTVTQALEQSGFTLPQLRALVSAGIIKTLRQRRGGALLYCTEDLQRFDGMPRNAEPAEQSPVLLELRAISDGYKSMLELALRQTKQAQDHERALVTAFSKPLETLMNGVQQQVGAMVTQNAQLLERATAGDVARLDFVKAGEGMLRERRNEEQERSQQQQSMQIRGEAWDAVKKAAPYLLDGLKATVAGGTEQLEQLKAAMLLKEKLDIGKVAALASFLDEEQTALLCKAFGFDRAELDRLNAEASAAEAAEAAEKAAAAAAPEAAE